MKLSVITINYNNHKGLKTTIESVVNQTFGDFEYIVIDGASSDGSLDVIKEYSGKISYWKSEPDKGIYHAMNKGVMAAKGEYLLFLNSGDWFCNNTILKDFVKDTDDCDIIYGDQYRYFPDGRIAEDKYPDILTFYYLGYLNSPPHQASLIKRSYLVEHGFYDEEMKMNADWKFFMLAIFKWQCKYKHKAIFVVYFSMDGISSVEEHFHLREKEKDPVLLQEFPNFILYKKQMEEIDKLKFYYKYSRITRVLKKLGIIKHYDY